jgi:2-polyprenyl-3-methyl-5-hydroxy-6-metoxy-1,4-benzoquinol methylase
MNALFLDAEVLRLVPRKRQQPLHILDLGCGIGSITIPLALEGHYVTAIDILPGMIQRLRRDLPESAVSRVNIHCADVQNVQLQEQQDCAILNLIIDHITDPVPLLKKVHKCLKEDGKMILTIPHPFKDSGTWDKTPSKEGWTYHSLSVDNYFAQGLIDKCREDVNGNVVLSGIQTQKRTLQAYFQMLVDCGFLVDAIYEPFPATDVTSDSYNAQFEKASRIPYFIVFVCVRHFGFQQTSSP